MKKLPDIPFEKITRIPLFSDLRPEEVRVMIREAHWKHQEANGFYYHKGDPAEHMYVLIHGRVKGFQLSPDGKQVLIQIIKPYDPFGLAVLTSSEYPVCAQAASDSSVICWSRRELMHFVSQMPHMALNAMRMMAEQLHEMQDRFSQVTTQRVDQRLAHALIRLAAESGKRVKQGILIDLYLTRQDLADMCGTTLYSASRIISHWHAQHLVIAGRGQVTIYNPHGLAEIIQS